MHILIIKTIHFEIHAISILGVLKPRRFADERNLDTPKSYIKIHASQKLLKNEKLEMNFFLIFEK